MGSLVLLKRRNMISCHGNRDICRLGTVQVYSSVSASALREFFISSFVEFVSVFV